jgi:hypothetical protein
MHKGREILRMTIFFEFAKVRFLYTKAALTMGEPIVIMQSDSA